MKARSFIRLAWIPGMLLLFLGVSIWLGRREPAPASAPGLTRHEASRQSAPAVRLIRQTLLASPPAPQPAGPAIRLRTATLTPPDARPADAVVPVHARPSPRGYPWLVLFDGPLRPEWRTSLENAGATLRAYLPDNALLVEAPPEALARLARLAHVAWSGEYRPEHKLQPLLAALSRQEPDLPVPITLQTFSPDDVAGLARHLAAAGASDLRATPAKRWGLVRAVLPARAAAELARLPEVQWVEHHEIPRILNDQALGGNRLNIVPACDDHGLDGAGQIVAIADTGLDTGDTNTLHPDFAGRLLHVFDTGRLTNWSDTYYHGTHVAGSLLGSGAASSSQYRGAAPAAQLVFQSIMTAGETLALPDDLNEFYRPPYGLGARIHSDSWGSAVAGEYTADSMTTDEFIWDHPDLLAAYAAGNGGIDQNRDGVVDLSSLDAPGSAKNALTVGASESGRVPGSGGYTGRSYGSAWFADYPVAPLSSDYISSSPPGEPQGMAAYSSRGPAADGRTKPDLVAPGTDIVSVRSRASSDTGWGVLAANTNYCFMGGTSMATPLAAGAATLVRQYCTDFLDMAAPSAALLKAALVGGARPLSPGQYGTGAYREIPELPRPNPVEGWGQADVGGTLFPPAGLQAALMDGPALSTGASNAFVFSVHSNAPLAVAMAYSDYPSALAAAANLVNDLDLRLLDPGGIPHHPNGLEGPDDLNNVESIDVAAAATGLWTLVVSARNVPEGPQPYALYLRGAIRMPATLQHAPLQNSFATNQPHLVSATVTSAGELDAGSVQLHWNLTGSTSAFTTATMASTNGTLFTAGIPAQPVGSRIWYFLSAGPPELKSVHPAGAPAALHVFDITPPVALAVSGLPANFFTVDPAYGVHVLASNTPIHAFATYPLQGVNGWRTACVGWQGAGSVPPAGAGDSCDFTLAGPSIIAWLWQEQVALTHASAPAGALGGDAWHAVGGTASSWIAPESHSSSNGPLTFAGWTLDGARWPAPPAPSRHQIDGIPMPAPRAATALYLPTAQDGDANHLPDWFELRYYGQLGRNRYADDDDDGFEDELEAADHTDPLDDASVPAPPVIQHAPLASPASSPAPWPVVAVVTDNYRVASATLHWRRNGGLARSVAMAPDPAAPDRFLAQIPSPARDGDVIAYHLAAADAAGISAQSATWTVSVAYARMAVSPAAAEVSAPADSPTNAVLLVQSSGSQPLSVSLELAPLGFADDVESGTNGWSRPDGNVDWHISAQDSHSPSRAWYCGQEIWREYRNSTHAALVSPPIQLAAGAPRLDFRHRARFEPDVSEFPDGLHYWDSGVLEITDNDGLAWQALVPEGGYPGLVTSNMASPFAPDTPCFVDTAGWDPVGADLSAFANRQIRLRFRFGADQYVVAEGWRIDDIVVSPRTEYAGWLALPATNFTLAPGAATNLVLALDPAALPPMASGHLAVLLHHDDPEQPSPLVVPIALHNTTRRVRVSTAGEGQADPAGDTLLAPDEPFSVEFSAAPGFFIADLQTNAVLAPLPEVVSTQTLQWASLAGNLDIQAVFAPRLAEGSVSPVWLAGYGLTSRHWMAEASLDQDRDGLLTWQEEQLESSPVDPADAPLVVKLLRPALPDTAWRLTWHAFTNRNASYDVLATSNYVEGFVVFTNLVARPPVMTSPPLLPNHRAFGLRKP
ncbi:MAG: hypothetical protein EOM72_08120 [Opitutae bacterium]|nr:hypothetical protein [Opitutae bacterium]